MSRKSSSTDLSTGFFQSQNIQARKRPHSDNQTSQLPPRKKYKRCVSTTVSARRRKGLEKAREAKRQKQQELASHNSTKLSSTDSTQGVVSETIVPGSRIMNIKELATQVQKISGHSASCGGHCILTGEQKLCGLASTLSFQCSECKCVFKIESSKKATLNDGSDGWMVNVAAVLGQVTTGGGLSHLNQTLAMMEVPGMKKKLYSKTENYIGREMKNQLVKCMADAARAEREHAIACGSYHQGIPAVKVVVDGGWSKRTHKHTYNARSGVAVIFGHYTKKLLFLGVRNKFCSVCAIHENKSQDVPSHKCFKNWNSSSASMESDIICEGFRLSEVQYGIRYMFVVGDGDSSVMANIRSSVPYGIFVTKIECANHACKAYRSRLEQLVKDCPQYKGKGGLTKRAIQRLTTGARLAIKYHSTNGKNVSQLRHDLRNGPAHVFGDHSKCGNHFCKKSLVQNLPQSSTNINRDDHPQEDESPDKETMTIVNTIELVIDEELEGNTIDENMEQDAVNAYAGRLDALPEGLYSRVLACGDRLVMLAEHLIDNETSNLAECYMSIRTCFDGGKQINRIQSGSFEHRCYAAGLRVQNGSQWLGQTLSKITGEKPGKVLTSYIKAKENKLSKDKSRKQSLEYRLQRKKTKYSSLRIQQNSDPDYGLTSQQPDVSKEELDRLSMEFYEREVSVTVDKASLLEQRTRLQSDDSLWFQQRRLRLTASNFGKVARRRITTPVASLVKTLLYNKPANTKALRWGKAHETDAESEYIRYLAQCEYQGAKVTRSGLVVHQDDPCLACSPDGLVEYFDNNGYLHKGLVEYKCPFTLAEQKKTPVEGCSMSTFCCHLVNGVPKLKITHPYYYQVQGSLAITGRQWCDFVVWTPSGISVERITASTDFWENYCPTLKQFYHKAILPELALPRYPSKQSIREPFASS